jgi:hypothetical protein
MIKYVFLICLVCRKKKTEEAFYFTAVSEKAMLSSKTL